MQLMRGLRNAIIDQNYVKHVQDFFRKQFDSRKGSKPDQWAIDALAKVGIAI